MTIVSMLPFLVPFIKLLYTQILYPLALSYVSHTDAKWDDSVLKFLDQLINDLLGQAGSKTRVSEGKIL